MLLLFSLAINDRLFLLDEAPTGRIFISVKSRDNRWPFHGFQFTPWQRDIDWNVKERQEKKGRSKLVGERWETHREACHRRLLWHDRQAEWQTLINTSLWLHFTWVQTCFHCYCISPTNIAGDICSHNIMDEISTRAEISAGISFSISLP